MLIMSKNQNKGNTFFKATFVSQVTDAHRAMCKQLLLMEWIKMDEMYHVESFALMSASCLLFLKMFCGWTASASSKQCIKSGGTQSFPSPATMTLWSEPIEREKIAKIFKLLIFRGSDIMLLFRYSFNNPYFYLSTLWIFGGQRVR